MPKPLEMQLRAFVSALCVTLGVASYHAKYRDKFVSDFGLLLFLTYVGTLVIIGFNHDSGIMAKAVSIIERIANLLQQIVNGRDRVVREQQSREREQHDGGKPTNPA